MELKPRITIIGIDTSRNQSSSTEVPFIMVGFSLKKIRGFDESKPSPNKFTPFTLVLPLEYVIWGVGFGRQGFVLERMGCTDKS